MFPYDPAALGGEQMLVEGGEGGGLPGDRGKRYTARTRGPPDGTYYVEEDSITLRPPGSGVDKEVHRADFENEISGMLFVSGYLYVSYSTPTGYAGLERIRPSALP